MRSWCNKTPMLVLVGWIALGVLSGSGTPALAEGANAPSQNNKGGNFEMEVLADGSIARLNRQTGAMSLCIVKDGEMVCRLSADERDAYEAEIARLSEKLSSGDTNENSAAQSEEGQRMKFDRAMEFSQEFMRRFFGVIEEMKKEYPDLGGNGANPDN